MRILRNLRLPWSVWKAKRLRVAQPFSTLTSIVAEWAELLCRDFSTGEGLWFVVDRWVFQICRGLTEVFGVCEVMRIPGAEAVFVSLGDFRGLKPAATPVFASFVTVSLWTGQNTGSFACGSG
jgi:hypothetical protein